MTLNNSFSLNLTLSCQQVAYRLYDSLSQRFISLSILSDQTKLAGLGPSEASRVRQYEQKMWEVLEKLRMIKCYRTSRMQNTLFNIFTLVLAILRLILWEYWWKRRRVLVCSYLCIMFACIVWRCKGNGRRKLLRILYSRDHSTANFLLLFKFHATNSHLVSLLCDCKLFINLYPPRFLIHV